VVTPEAVVEANNTNIQEEVGTVVAVAVAAANTNIPIWDILTASLIVKVLAVVDSHVIVVGQKIIKDIIKKVEETTISNFNMSNILLVNNISNTKGNRMGCRNSNHLIEIPTILQPTEANIQK